MLRQHLYQLLRQGALKAVNQLPGPPQLVRRCRQDAELGAECLQGEGVEGRVREVMAVSIASAAQGRPATTHRAGVQVNAHKVDRLKLLLLAKRSEIGRHSLAGNAPRLRREEIGGRESAV